MVVCTAELAVNSLLNLDFGGKQRLIGIEFFNEEANRLRDLAGQKHVFRVVQNKEHEYFSFRVSDEIRNSSYHLNQAVTFHFCKPNYKGFLGIDIYRTEDYWTEMLTGKTDH
jgi:hypothetical protein